MAAMRAIAIPGFGGRDRLTLMDLPVPAIGPPWCSSACRRPASIVPAAAGHRSRARCARSPIIPDAANPSDARGPPERAVHYFEARPAPHTRRDVNLPLHYRVEGDYLVTSSSTVRHPHRRARRARARQRRGRTHAPVPLESPPTARPSDRAPPATAAPV